MLAALLLAGLGAAVPAIPVASLDGQPASLATSGKVTAVIFLSTRCPISNDYNLRMQALYQTYAPKGVQFVFINSNFNEPSSEVAQHAREARFAFPVWRDPNNAAAGLLGADLTPETYVLDRSGIVRYHGAIDDAKNPARVKKHALAAALDAVLASKPVPTPELLATGCTIKRKSP